MSEGTVSILDRLRDLSSQKFIPMQASLELTNRCNERCTHCYIEDFSDDVQRILDKEQWFHILHELRAAGTLYLILMGGEAMLNPYFWDILQKSSQLNFHTSMISNGLKIQTEETAKTLADYGLKNLTISLYSLSPKIHDGMTQVKGSHMKTMNAIHLARAAGIDVTLNCLLSKENIESCFELEDWAVAKNFSLKFDPMITPKLNGNLAPTQMRANPTQLKWFYTERARRWERGLPAPSGETAENYTCNAGKGKCAITAYGELLPCIEIREPLGNLTKSSFKDLWHSETVQPWRNMKWKDIVGADQDTISFCDHCPGMAKNEVGDGKKTTCFSKTIAAIKKDIYLKRTT